MLQYQFNASTFLGMLGVQRPGNSYVRNDNFTRIAPSKTKIKNSIKPPEIFIVHYGHLLNEDAETVATLCARREFSQTTR